jgi:hypothetical protein
MLGGDSNRPNNTNRVIERLRRAGDFADYGDQERISLLRDAIESMRRVELGRVGDLDDSVKDDRFFSPEDNEAPAAY